MGCCRCNLVQLIRRIVSEMLPQGTTEGIQATLTGNYLVLANNETVPFNSLVSPASSRYTFAPGQITINIPGTYMVNWQVAVDGSDVDTNLTFAVAVNGVPHSSMSTPAVTSLVAGSAVVVANAGDVITLVNVSEQNIRLADTKIQANITIIG